MPASHAPDRPPLPTTRSGRPVAPLPVTHLNRHGMVAPKLDELEILINRIRAVTGGNRRFKVSNPHEVALLAGLSPLQLATLAERAQCNVVPRMGRSVFEFTRSGRLCG